MGLPTLFTRTLLLPPHLLTEPEFTASLYAFTYHNWLPPAHYPIEWRRLHFPASHDPTDIALTSRLSLYHLYLLVLARGGFKHILPREWVVISAYVRHKDTSTKKVDVLGPTEVREVYHRLLLGYETYTRIVRERFWAPGLAERAHEEDAREMLMLVRKGRRERLDASIQRDAKKEADVMSYHSIPARMLQSLPPLLSTHLVPDEGKLVRRYVSGESTFGILPYVKGEPGEPSVLVPGRVVRAVEGVVDWNRETGRRGGERYTPPPSSVGFGWVEDEGSTIKRRRSGSGSASGSGWEEEDSRDEVLGRVMNWHGVDGCEQELVRKYGVKPWEGDVPEVAVDEGHDFEEFVRAVGGVTGSKMREWWELRLKMEGGDEKFQIVWDENAGLQTRSKEENAFARRKVVSTHPPQTPTRGSRESLEKEKRHRLDGKLSGNSEDAPFDLPLPVDALTREFMERSCSTAKRSRNLPNLANAFKEPSQFLEINGARDRDVSGRSHASEWTLVTSSSLSTQVITERPTPVVRPAAARCDSKAIPIMNPNAPKTQGGFNVAANGRPPTRGRRWEDGAVLEEDRLTKHPSDARGVSGGHYYKHASPVRCPTTANSSRPGTAPGHQQTNSKRQTQRANTDSIVRPENHRPAATPRLSYTPWDNGMDIEDRRPSQPMVRFRPPPSPNTQDRMEQDIRQLLADSREAAQYAPSLSSNSTSTVSSSSSSSEEPSPSPSHMLTWEDKVAAFLARIDGPPVWGPGAHLTEETEPYGSDSDFEAPLTRQEKIEREIREQVAVSRRARGLSSQPSLQRRHAENTRRQTMEKSRDPNQTRELQRVLRLLEKERTEKDAAQAELEKIRRDKEKEYYRLITRFINNKDGVFNAQGQRQPSGDNFITHLHPLSAEMVRRNRRERIRERKASHAVRERKERRKERQEKKMEKEERKQEKERSRKNSAKTPDDEVVKRVDKGKGKAVPQVVEAIGWENRDAEAVVNPFWNHTELLNTDSKRADKGKGKAANQEFRASDRGNHDAHVAFEAFWNNTAGMASDITNRLSSRPRATPVPSKAPQLTFKPGHRPSASQPQSSIKETILTVRKAPSLGQLTPIPGGPMNQGFSHVETGHAPLPQKTPDNSATGGLLQAPLSAGPTSPKTRAAAEPPSSTHQPPPPPKMSGPAEEKDPVSGKRASTHDATAKTTVGATKPTETASKLSVGTAKPIVVAANLPSRPPGPLPPTIKINDFRQIKEHEQRIQQNMQQSKIPPPLANPASGKSANCLSTAPAIRIAPANPPPFVPSYERAQSQMVIADPLPQAAFASGIFTHVWSKDAGGVPKQRAVELPLGVLSAQGLKEVVKTQSMAQMHPPIPQYPQYPQDVEQKQGQNVLPKQNGKPQKVDKGKQKQVQDGQYQQAQYGQQQQVPYGHSLGIQNGQDLASQGQQAHSQQAQSGWFEQNGLVFGQQIPLVMEQDPFRQAYPLHGTRGPPDFQAQYGYAQPVQQNAWNTGPSQVGNTGAQYGGYNTQQSGYRNHQRTQSSTTYVKVPPAQQCRPATQGGPGPTRRQMPKKARPSTSGAKQSQRTDALAPPPSPTPSAGSYIGDTAALIKKFVEIAYRMELPIYENNADSINLLHNLGVSSYRFTTPEMRCLRRNWALVHAASQGPPPPDIDEHQLPHKFDGNHNLIALEPMTEILAPLRPVKPGNYDPLYLYTWYSHACTHARYPVGVQHLVHPLAFNPPLGLSQLQLLILLRKLKGHNLHPLSEHYADRLQFSGEETLVRYKNAVKQSGWKKGKSTWPHPKTLKVAWLDEEVKYLEGLNSIPGGDDEEEGGEEEKEEAKKTDTQETKPEA